MSRKLKIANLVLAVLCMIFLVTSITDNNIYPGILPIIFIFIVIQIFQVVYAVKDFSREGKTLWFILSVFPSPFIFMQISAEILSKIFGPLVYDALPVYVFIPLYILPFIALIIYYIIVVINKISYWKKIKGSSDEKVEIIEIKISELVPTLISMMSSRKPKVDNTVPALKPIVNIKLKVANLILTIILLFYSWSLSMYFDVRDLSIIFILLIASLIFLLEYTIKDFSREGKTLWFVCCIVPIVCLLLFELWQSLMGLFLLSIYNFSDKLALIYILFSIFIPVAVIVFYIKVVNNKINYWKKVKEIHE